MCLYITKDSVNVSVFNGIKTGGNVKVHCDKSDFLTCVFFVIFLCVFSLFFLQDYNLFK